ncbi:hypothetical protein [Agaribacterium haliotis]|uniref:hypothetical protein n=1 Tax=Agaribacterium haliotis TaxID=2013869 RepID=UPI000BB57F5F|nr:hypothetical protein [Agaribacterium haliotis]
MKALAGSIFNWQRLDIVKFALCCVLLLAGLFYFQHSQLEISGARIGQQQLSLPIDNVLRYGKQPRLQLELKSASERTAQVNMISSAGFRSLLLNGQALSPAFAYPKTRTSHRDAVLGDLYLLPLQRGDNQLVIEFKASSQPVSFAFAQSRFFSDWLLALLLIILPVSFLAAHLFIWAWGFVSASRFNLSQWRWRADYGLWALLLIAVLLRIVYWSAMGATQFQHDYHGHIEYIEFWANHGFSPLPHKGWEYPQQPFYYVLNGAIFAAMKGMGLEKSSILFYISALAMLLNCVALYYFLGLLKRLTPDRLLQYAAFCFYAFMPSLVFASTRISNDSWTLALATMAAYFVVAAWQTGWSKFFYRALIFTSFAFLCKISTLVIELLFIALLLHSLYYSGVHKLKTQLLVFALVGASILSLTLFRAWYPAASAFHFVNSGIWGGQHIQNFDLFYLASFHFGDILSHAEAAINNQDTRVITRSFPSYQYVTMFFGEFDYSWWRNQAPLLKLVQQASLLLGLLVPLAWLVFLCSKKRLLDYLFVVMLLVGLFLQLKFVFDYPSVSNTDFRYHAPYMFVFAWFFGRGIAYICRRWPAVKKLTLSLVGVLSALNISFILMLVAI